MSMAERDAAAARTGRVFGMAERAGVDLPRLTRDRVLSEADVEHLEVRCGTCREVGACRGHLRQGTEGVPGYCVNADIFARLAGE